MLHFYIYYLTSCQNYDKYDNFVTDQQTDDTGNIGEPTFLIKLVYVSHQKD